jgi:MFS family permease
MSKLTNHHRGEGGGDGVSGAVLNPRAPLAVGATFFLTGLVFATWAARIPAIKQDLGLTGGGLAVAFVGLNAGAVLGLQLGGILVPRIGSRPALRVALPAFAAALIGIAFAPNGLLLTVALAVSGAINSIIDVAMNAHGVAVEQRSRKPLLARFHAMHPLGGIVGGGIGTLAASLHLTVLVHFGTVALVVVLAALPVTAHLLPASIDAGASEESGGSRFHALISWFQGWSRTTLAFGVMAFCVTLAEGSMLDWGAIYLRENLNASGSGAAAGVTVFLGGVTLGRFAGDWTIARLGSRRAFRIGVLVAIAGSGMVPMFGTVAVGIAAFGLIGVGLSYLLPLLFSAAGSIPGERSAASVVARVSTLGYLGSFVGPALIGVLAEQQGLARALTLPVVLLACTVVGAGAILRAASPTSGGVRE